MRKIDKARYFLKLFLLFFLVVALTLGVKSIFTFLYTNSAFKVAKLEILGNYPLDSEIKESILGANIFKINLKRLSQKIITQHPEILKAEVRRLLPNKIIIELKTRLPFAVIESQGYPYRTFFVDKEGFILKNIKPISSEELPTILGINTELARIREGSQSESIQLLKALSLLEEIGARKDTIDYKVNKVDVTSYKNLSFFINGDIEVKIGAGNFKQRLNLLDRTLTELKAEGFKPEYIDLRFGDPIIGTR